MLESNSDVMKFLDSKQIVFCDLHHTCNVVGGPPQTAGDPEEAAEFRYTYMTIQT